MNYIIPIQIAVEDLLSEAVVRRIVKHSKRPFHIYDCFNRGGNGYLRNRINSFNQAARHIPFLVLTDLDHAECPVEVINEWLIQPKHENLIFRVAVKEVETWLLADMDGFASYIGIPANTIPNRVETINNPKEFLVNLARRSRKRTIRDDIVPTDNTTARVGPNYNGCLIEFVNNSWDVENASNNSISLQKMILRIQNFHPINN